MVGLRKTGLNVLIADHPKHTLTMYAFGPSQSYLPAGLVGGGASAVLAVVVVAAAAAAFVVDSEEGCCGLLLNTVEPDSGAGKDEYKLLN